MNILLQNLKQIFRYDIKRQYSSKKISLVGRDLKSFKDYTPEEIKSLLWTAFDLFDSRKNGKQPRTHFKITLLMNEPEIKIQTAASRAALAIGAHLNVIVNPQWEQTPNVWTIGKMLSPCCDMILCKAKDHGKLEELADGASIPVVNVSTSKHTPMQCLCNLMTIHNHFCHLRGLTLAYVSPAGPVLNTFLSLLPKVKINLKFACASNSKKPITPVMLKIGQALCKKYGTEMHECVTATSAIKKADVIIAIQHNVENLSVKMQDIEAANENWIYIHHLPRGKVEVDDEVFSHKNCAVWDESHFVKDVYAAVMLRLLKDHNHSIEVPGFDD